MSAEAPAPPQERNDNDVDVDEADELRTVNGLIYDKVYKAAEKFAGTHVGQYTTKKVDRVLKLVEDTAKWSLPQNSQHKNDSSEPLERPLPWIPFIAMIVMLRMVRLSLSIGGLFIGNAPLLPGDVVYFIQTRRRKLRAIRIVGMRDIRKKQQARGEKQMYGLLSKLQSLLSVVVCRPGQSGEEEPSSSAIQQNSSEEASNTEGNEAKDDQNLPSSKRRRAEDEDDVFDNNLTLDQIIDKYGEASSDNDSDYIPPNEEINDEDTSSQSTSSATSDDDDDDDELKPSREVVNPESDAHMTNGNRRDQAAWNTTENQINDNSVVIKENENEQAPWNTTENQVDDNSVVIKENGEHFSKASRRPVPLPKPYKREQVVPVPIQDIKQELLDSDEDRSSSQQMQQDPAELKRSSEQLQHQQQQSVVARNDGPKDMDIADADKKVNGDEHLSGSPNLKGNFGFQPTSILKNPNAVHLEKRGPEVAYTEEDDNASKAERTATESHATSIPISTSAKGTTHSTGKHNKNKFRGKRR